MLFTGGFNVAAGTVITSANTLCLPVSGTVAFTNPVGTSATIQSTQSHTIAALAGGNSDSALAVSGANGLTVNGAASTTFGGVIQDNGSSPTRLTYAGSGSLTLTNDNTYTGTTTVTSGRLALGATGSLASPSLIIGAGATLDVSAVPGGFTLQDGTTLAGGSGASAGMVLGAFTVGSGATLVPGTAPTGTGTLSFANGFTLASDAHLLFQLNGTAAGTGYDQLLVSGGPVALAGDLNGSTLGYTPAFGDTFYLVRNTGSGGTSGTLNGVADGGKLDFGGKWFRVSFTSQQGGAGFQTGGTGKDVAIQRIDDPTPSAFDATYVGPTDQTTAQLQLSWQNNAASATGFHIYLVQPDGSLQLVATLAASATSYSATVGSTGVYTYAIQAYNASGPLGDLNYVTTPRLGNTLADRQSLILDYLNTNTPNLSQTGSGPHRVGRTGFWFGEGRLQRGDAANGLNYIATALEDANAESSNAGFSLWPGMDAYFRWGSSFSTALKSRYQTIYTRLTLQRRLDSQPAFHDLHRLLPGQHCLGECHQFGLKRRLPDHQSLRASGQRHGHRPHRQDLPPEGDRAHPPPGLRGGRLQPLPPFHPCPDPDAVPFRHRPRPQKRGPDGVRLRSGCRRFGLVERPQRHLLLPGWRDRAAEQLR